MFLILVTYRFEVIYRRFNLFIVIGVEVILVIAKCNTMENEFLKFHWSFSENPKKIRYSV